MDQPSLKSQARSALRVLVWVAVAQAAVIALLLVRQVGESQRTHAAVADSAARQAVLIQADCRYLFDMAGVAALSPTPSRVLVRIAQDAADGYVRKGCTTATDASTGKSFGPPPAIPLPVITTPPPR